jgi:hypothetical protein
MTRCDLRGVECACPSDRCSVQPLKAQEAPIRFSVRDQLVVCAFIGVVAGIVTFAVAARAEPYLKDLKLDCQEACVAWK